MSDPASVDGIVTVRTSAWIGGETRIRAFSLAAANVAFGSKGDVGGRLLLVWFTPHSGSAVRGECLSYTNKCVCARRLTGRQTPVPKSRTGYTHTQEPFGKSLGKGFVTYYPSICIRVGPGRWALRVSVITLSRTMSPRSSTSLSLVPGLVGSTLDNLVSAH